ncbi:MAG: hypothetical protein O2894_09990 [Planctomycetota bacterium]|nr:hypothetical protein [Planctomycetota bacterium]
MTLHPAVLVGLRPEPGLAPVRELGADLDGWVRRLGFSTRISTDAREVRSWLGKEQFAVSFVDSDLGLDDGEPVWRTLRPQTARRTVLLVRERRRDLWFEALRTGVATVLTLPLHESVVRAAFRAVVGEPGAEP